MLGQSHEVMTAAVRQEEESIRVVHQFAELNRECEGAEGLVGRRQEAGGDRANVGKR